MNARIARLVLAVAVGAGAVVGLGLGPASALAESGQPAVTSLEKGGREGAIKRALAGLVGEGVLTQAQADKVAATLAHELPKRPHGPGRHHKLHHKLHGVLEDAAAAIGVTVPELRDALRDGATLAEVAAGKGVSKATLIDKLVKAAEARLALAVQNGRLTRAEADERKAALREKITALVDRDLPKRRPDVPGTVAG